MDSACESTIGSDAAASVDGSTLLQSKNAFEVNFRQKLTASIGLIPAPIKLQLFLGTGMTFDVAGQSAALLGTAIDQKSVMNTMSLAEVVNNQPKTNPLPVQRAVGKEIITIISSIDGFGWSSQRARRTGDGWQLLFHCYNSCENMSRHSNRIRKKEEKFKAQQQCPAQRREMSGNQKVQQVTPTAAEVGTYECNGRLEIVFSESKAHIRIDYEHHPIHQGFEASPQARKKPARTREVMGGSSEERCQLLDSPAPILSVEQHRQALEFHRKALEAMEAMEAMDGVDSMLLPESGVLNGPAATVQSPSYVWNSNAPAATRSTKTNPSFNIVQERSSSVDVSLNRVRALSLLAGGGVDLGALSEMQLEVFQDQDANLQRATLQLFQLHGPKNLIVVPKNAAFTFPRPMDIRHPHSIPRQPSADLSREMSQHSYRSNNLAVESPRRRLNHLGREGSMQYYHSQAQGTADPCTKGIQIEQNVCIVLGPESTINGTPKQPGIFEYNSDVKKEVAKAVVPEDAGNKGGKRTRKAVSPEGSRKRILLQSGDSSIRDRENVDMTWLRELMEASKGS